MTITRTAPPVVAVATTGGATSPRVVGSSEPPRGTASHAPVLAVAPAGVLARPPAGALNSSSATGPRDAGEGQTTVPGSADLGGAVVVGGRRRPSGPPTTTSTGSSLPIIGGGELSGVERWGCELCGGLHRSGPCPPEINYQHGTLYGHQIGRCRCQPCRTAFKDYSRLRHRLKAYGQWAPFVDAEPARVHIAQLRASGIGTPTIAKLAGLSRPTVDRIVYGDYVRKTGPAKNITAETAAAILAVTVEVENLPPAAYVDGTGTRRRLQALTALGWPQKVLAARLGADRTTIGALVRGGGKVRAGTAQAVRRLYDELWDQAPPKTTRADKVSASRARNTATANDWPPPAAWDDDSIDDPAASADRGTAVPWSVAIAENADELERQGFTQGQVAERLGTTANAIRKARRRVAPKTGA